jgi:hypothetical protein
MSVVVGVEVAELETERCMLVSLVDTVEDMFVVGVFGNWVEPWQDTPADTEEMRRRKRSREVHALSPGQVEVGCCQ